MDAVFRFGRGVGLLIGIVSVILYYIFAPQIMQAFIADTDTVRFGTQFLRARCFATPLMFLCFSMVHFTQAIGRGKESFWLAVIRQLVFNIPMLFLLSCGERVRRPRMESKLHRSCVDRICAVGHCVQAMRWTRAARPICPIR